jgi:hypothetical protein
MTRAAARAAAATGGEASAAPMTGTPSTTRFALTAANGAMNETAPMRRAARGTASGDEKRKDFSR